MPSSALNRNRDFTILWIGDMVSELGSGMSALVFTLLGYTLTHSATQAALTTTAVFAGGTIARLPAGALVDRWSRRRVLVASNVASALVFGVLAVLVATGTASIVALVVGGFAAGVAGTFVSPAASASVRAVVPPEDLPVAYARMQGRHHVANLIGPPLGGALFAVTVGLPFAVDAATFVAFAGAVRFLKSKLPPPAQSERAKVRRDVTEGLRYLWSQHGVRAIHAAGTLVRRRGEGCRVWSTVMSLMLLPVDEAWVDRMVALADVPWERARVEAMLVAWGLARSGEDVEWGWGAGAPQATVDADGKRSGWSVELGAAPPDPDLWVHLPCALYWPPFGAERPDDPDDQDEFEQDLPALWARQPDAGRAGFHAERDRLATLITARLGAPETVTTGAYDSYRAVWRRGDRALLLETTDDIHTYSHYDVLAIRLRPYSPSLTDLDA